MVSPRRKELTARTRTFFARNRFSRVLFPSSSTRLSIRPDSNQQRRRCQRASRGSGLVYRGPRRDSAVSSFTGDGASASNNKRVDSLS